MVAYSFKKMFASQVEDGTKTQTIRAARKGRVRHARPGEFVQLYTAQRTKYCRKLVMPDPICLSVQPVEIHTTDLISDFLASIAIDGALLTSAEIERFARSDGFGPEIINGLSPLAAGKTARQNMGRFWIAQHGAGHFAGVLITWASDP